jgi:hypothetical protein
MSNSIIKGIGATFESQPGDKDAPGVSLGSVRPSRSMQHAWGLTLSQSIATTRQELRWSAPK